MIKDKIQNLAVEWGIPAAIGVAVLGSCVVKSYVEGDKPAETQAAEKPKNGVEDAITIVTPALGL